MAKLYGKDTYLIDQKLSHKADGLFLVYILFIGIATYWIYLFTYEFSHVGANIAASLLLIFYFWMREPIKQKLWMLRRMASGLQGEESIRSILLTLPNDYIIFENIVIPALTSNIDFVVLCPAGIFSIEVKNHTGSVSYEDNRIFVRGRDNGDFLSQTKGGAIRIRDYLASKQIESPTVQPILVFSSKHAVVLFGLKPLDGVITIRSPWLLRAIQDHPPILTTAQVAEISGAILALVPKHT